MPRSTRSSFYLAAVSGLLLACGPVAGMDEPDEGGSEAGDSSGEDSTGDLSQDHTTGEADGSTGETLDSWCLVAQPLGFPDDQNPNFVANADVDGNGQPELWARYSYGEEEYRVYSSVQATDGSFDTVTHLGDDLVRLSSVVDVDGDGYDDAVFMQWGNDPSYWRAGQADGTFSAEMTELVDTARTWAHIDGDDIADRIRDTGDGNYALELGAGDGTFTEVGSLDLGPSHQVFVLPVRDIPGRFAVQADDGGIGFATSFINVYMLDVEETLWQTGYTEVAQPKSWGLLDVDDDGIVDMVLKNMPQSDNGLTLARGQADGTFVPELLVPWEGALDGAVGDLDGDGRADVLWQIAADDTIGLRRGVPGGFEPAVPVLGPSTLGGFGPRPVDPVDYDGDGRDSWVTVHQGQVQAQELVRCTG